MPYYTNVIELDSSGVATVNFSNLPVGNYAIHASYPGDANFPASDSS